MSADTTINWSNPILYIQLNPPKRSKMMAKYTVIILQAATHATNIKNGPLKRTHITLILLLTSMQGQQISSAVHFHLVTFTLTRIGSCNDLYLRNTLSIKLMSSNGLRSTVMNILRKQERKEATFSRKTLMFLFPLLISWDREGNAQYSPWYMWISPKLFLYQLIYFPKRPANLHSMLSRENSTVAITIICMFALTQSRLDLMTFQTID